MIVPGEIVGARLVEARHLRRLAARQRHAVGAATARDALDQPGDLLDAESRARDVVHERDRRGAVHQNIVDAVVDEILAHRVEAPGLERHQHLGADAVGAEHQRRLPHAGGHPHHPAECADLPRPRARSASRPPAGRSAPSPRPRFARSTPAARVLARRRHASVLGEAHVREVLRRPATRAATSASVTVLEAADAELLDRVGAHASRRPPWRGGCRRRTPSPRARGSAMKPPANASPAPVGSNTFSSGKAGT